MSKAGVRGAIVLVLVVAAPAAADGPSYRRDVLPILSANCFACHGFDANARQAGLRLDTAEGATALLESGSAAVVPGDVAASTLLRRVDATGDDIMPPRASGHVLGERERSVLRDWIASGGRYERHWAFDPPVDVVPPGAPGLDHPHPIDRFLEARMAGTGLSLSPEASPETLLRRASLDLTGLPPAPEEIDAYLAARAVDPERAWEEVLDRLLASPHYGERQARHWLDMARYADSNGYSIDAPREIWPWRDWVVRAFNADMPFDEFTVRQIAGDLLPGATDDDRVATGFHRNTQINEEGGIDPEQFRVDAVFDRVATTGSVWLGLTIGCAQCHDHKFDPVSQRDFYRLFAFFNDQSEPKLKVAAPGVDRVRLAAERDEARAAVFRYVAERRDALDAWEAGLNDDARGLLTGEQKKALAVAAADRGEEQRRILFHAGLGAGDQEFRRLNERYLELRTRADSGPTTLVLAELPEPRRTTIFVQGDFTRPADEVSPGVPEVLPAPPGTGGRPNRLDLARWLVSPSNPLAARVVVNRVWQRLFGRGLVETDADFGLAGSPPSHPELLDWLAREFVARGMSLKAFHRLVMTTRAYRQSSAETAERSAADPGNVLLARQRRLRLDAEIVRDVALAASGMLVPTLGGPPVHPPVPAGTTAVGQVKRDWPTSSGPDRFRRGLYTFVYRASPPPALAAFDAPDGYQSCTRRHRSNTPLQALVLLNDPAFVELADALAGIVRREGSAAAFRRCTGRLPDADEAAVLGALPPEDCARVLLNLDETVTRE